ncbi:hypothetical protein MKW92_023108 [Papaver armeniacum]|nr:hypothetical protein MKW92_023108 [Papaver armeniacum]
MMVLEKLPYLKCLHLGFGSYAGKKMVCSGGGFRSLKTLEIISTEDLEEWTIEEGALRSLLNLEIRSCINLEMIPDGLQQLRTLKELKVVNMPLLFQSRMKEATGEDWNKIRHIPSLVVYGWE